MNQHDAPDAGLTNSTARYLAETHKQAAASGHVPHVDLPGIVRELEALTVALRAARAQHDATDAGLTDDDVTRYGREFRERFPSIATIPCVEDLIQDMQTSIATWRWAAMEYEQQATAARADLARVAALREAAEIKAKTSDAMHACFAEFEDATVCHEWVEADDQATMALAAALAQPADTQP